MQKPPLILENFGNAHSTEQGTGRRWAAFSEKTRTAVEIDNTQGRNALRMDYDFRVETTQGGSRRSYCRTYSTAGNHLDLRRELAGCPDTLVIPEGEYPTHLGIWLYGDGSAAWSNGGIVDARGGLEDIAYGDQDWVGWRFVTGAIPPGLKLPLYVSYPLRLLSGSKSIHGSVWLGAVMALYGGIDFDAVAPVIEGIAFDGGCITGKAHDPDDMDNDYPASGLDIARTEVTIDGARHTKYISLVPEGKGFALTCEPDFPLCEGYHKAEIAVYDNEGNAGRKAAFFRQGEGGVAWAMPAYACLGNTIDLDIAGVDDGCEVLHIDWACYGALERRGPRQLRVKHGLTGPESAGVRCVSAYYTKGGEVFPFCLPDLKVELTAGLELVLRHFCKGFDAQFIVRDKQGRPVPGARICCDGAYLQGVTDADGLLTAPGLTDGALGQKIEAFASYSDDFSYTKKANISQDFAQPLPANVTLTLRAAGEVGITWQCGVGVDEGYVNFAGRGDGAGQGDENDSPRPSKIIPAEAAPFFTTLHGEHTELSAFRAVLGGLEPGVRYFYRVGNPSGWSPVYSFRTPRDGPAFTFAVLGDTHNYCGGAMASALARQHYIGPDFFLHVGDYVGSGGAYDNWLALHGDSGGLAPNNLMLPVVGNHDTMDGDGAHYRMVFASPQNGPPGARPGMTYACEIGDALFTALGDGESEPATLPWLRDVLRSSDKPWRILFLHSGPYTCWINTDEYEKKLGGLAQQLGFHLVLSGHDHVYHRATIHDHITQPVGDLIRAGQGVTYVQCGSSGHGRSVPSREEDHRPIWNRVYDSTQAVYSVITVTRDKITLEGVELSDTQAEGIVFDRAEILSDTAAG